MGSVGGGTGGGVWTVSSGIWSEEQLLASEDSSGATGIGFFTIETVHFLATNDLGVLGGFGGDRWSLLRFFGIFF